MDFQVSMQRTGLPSFMQNGIQNVTAGQGENMISLYFRALAKRVDKKPLQQFKPPQLPVRIKNKVISIQSGHYASYCELTGWSDDSDLHPCYLQTLSLPLQMECLLDRKSPFPLLGLVHIRNTIIQHRCDKTLPFEIRVRFTGVRQHPRGWECDIGVTALQQGQCVYEATSTYLTRVKASHVEPREARAKVAEKTAAETSHDSDKKAIDVPENIGRRYARLSGDYNPIHLSHLAAKTFGFKRAIAHGMWTLARCYSAFAGGLTSPQDRVQLEAQFDKPVFLPASLHLDDERDADSEDNSVQTFKLMSDDNVNCHIRGRLEVRQTETR